MWIFASAIYFVTYSTFIYATQRLITPSAIYADVAQTAILYATFLNVTDINETSVEWTKEGALVNETLMQTIQTTTVAFRMYGKTVTFAGTNITLELPVTSSDYGYYAVEACTVNEACYSANVDLKPLFADLPPVPSDFHVVENLSYGFWFRWRSGVNAGGDQLFRLAYKHVDEADWYFKEVEDEEGAALPVHARISGLLPETTYYFKVRAAYAHDKDRVSNYTDPIPLFVKGPLHKPVDFGPGIGIGIGITVFIVLCITLPWCLFRFKKRKYSGKSMRNRNNLCSSCAQVDNTSRLNMRPTKPNARNAYDPPDLPEFPAPSLKSRPRPPVPGAQFDHAVISEVPRHKLPSNNRAQKAGTCQAGAPSVRPPLPLPLPLPLRPPPEEVYEPVEGEGEEEDGEESGEDYVIPTLPYENLH